MAPRDERRTALPPPSRSQGQCLCEHSLHVHHGRRHTVLPARHMTGTAAPQLHTGTATLHATFALQPASCFILMVHTHLTRGYGPLTSLMHVAPTCVCKPHTRTQAAAMSSPGSTQFLPSTLSDAHHTCVPPTWHPQSPMGEPGVPVGRALGMQVVDAVEDVCYQAPENSRPEHGCPSATSGLSGTSCGTWCSVSQKGPIIF